MTRAASHDEYLADVTGWQRPALDTLRAKLHELIPNAEEVISYEVPGYRVNGKVVWGYAALKKHCSHFPHSGQVFGQFADELDALGLKHNKGTLQFTETKPVPDDLLARMVAARLAMA